MKNSMRYRYLKFLAMALLTTAIFSAKANAQDAFSPELTLTLLRGTWEAHTFYDKWTLVFDCDHNMFFDREPVPYTLLPGVIRIRDTKEESDYPYKLDGNSLTLTLKNGSERTYRRTDPGDAEQTAHGIFYLSGNAQSARASISFDGDHSFVIYDPSAANSVKNTNGIYRVEGDVVVLIFDDSTNYDAKIRFHDEDGSIAGIMYDDQLFETEMPVQTRSVSGSYTPTFDPGGYNPPPPPYFPPPAAPTYLPTGGAMPAASSDKKTDNKPRDFGSTRGNPGGRQH
ncbi:MAG: hypothetical protein ABSF91_06805 [Bacteroidota bacterium]|jgi:hypothetical protein